MVEKALSENMSKPSKTFWASRYLWSTILMTVAHVEMCSWEMNSNIIWRADLKCWSHHRYGFLKAFQKHWLYRRGARVTAAAMLILCMFVAELILTQKGRAGGIFIIKICCLLSLTLATFLIYLDKWSY